MEEIEDIHEKLKNIRSAADQSKDHGAFAMPFTAQLKAVTVRTFQHYYRSPVYIGGKFILNVLASLFVGFTFYMTDNTVQGFQNKLFAVFMTVPDFLFLFACLIIKTTIGTALINQIQPRFFFLRDLYEIRERPSKIYHWLAFLIAAILAEIPWNLLVGTLFFFGWYFPVGTVIAFGHSDMQGSGRMSLCQRTGPRSNGFFSWCGNYSLAHLPSYSAPLYVRFCRPSDD